MYIHLVIIHLGNGQKNNLNLTQLKLLLLISWAFNNSKYVLAEFSKTIFRFTRSDQGATWEPSECCDFATQLHDHAVSGDNGPYGPCALPITSDPTKKPCFLHHQKLKTVYALQTNIDTHIEFFPWFLHARMKGSYYFLLHLW